MSENYRGAFNQGRNLTEESVGFSATLFRDELVFKIIQVIARQRSVLLVGSNGVGKTRVVHELAGQLRRSGRAKVFEFSVSQLLSGTKYLGEWESKVTQLLNEAAKARCILYFSDIWNLPTAAKSSNREGTAWDLIRPYIEQNKIQLLGEVTRSQLNALLCVKGFDTLFEAVEVPALTQDNVFSIVSHEAARLKLPMDNDTVSRVISLCQHFLAAAEGPGPALELVARVQDYHSQKRENQEPEAMSPGFVEKVFSIYSGLPLIVVSPSVTKPVSEVKAWFEEHIIGQRNAIEAVVETIALYKAGLHDPDRPIGSFLFVGPTGVGKTELARALARFLFGTENRLLRFDLSEYKDYHSFQLLIGDPNRTSQEARLIDPVKAKPFQVILLDEIEKAHANVWDILLQLLDEGRLTPTSGKPVNFRNTIVIATSNVGARERAQANVGFVAEDKDAGSGRMQKALELAFRPEFLNRFQHLVYFHPLSKDDVRQIARMELARILQRQGIASRNINVDVTPAVLELIVSEGYDDNYGARALRRTVQRFVTMPIATLLLEKVVVDGSILRLDVHDNKVKVEAIETPETRLQVAEARPIKSSLGTLSSRSAIQSFLQELQKSRLALLAYKKSESGDKPADEFNLELSSNHAWNKTIEMASAIRQRDQARSEQQRIDTLLQREAELAEWFERTVTREERQKLVKEIEHHKNDLDILRREIQVMPSGAYADALIEISPLGNNISSAISLFRLYENWATRHGYDVSIVCEPMLESEPLIVAVSGNYAFGYLHLEAGHHRFRTTNENTVIRVRVLPWLDHSIDVAFKSQRALKKRGLLGGKIRSRLALKNPDLLIQNERSLNDNRSFAASIAASYQIDDSVQEVLVRRYDTEPFLLKDYLLSTSTGKAETLSPVGFHKVLCARVQAAYDI